MHNDLNYMIYHNLCCSHCIVIIPNCIIVICNISISAYVHNIQTCRRTTILLAIEYIIVSLVSMQTLSDSNNF